MKVRCQYCESLFDLNENLNCPECGGSASQKDIDEYQKLQKEKELIGLRQKELEIHKKKHIFEEEVKQEKARKKFISVYIRILLIIFIGIPLLSTFIDVTTEMVNTYKEIQEERNKPVDVETVVSLNEKAQMVQYSVICDKVEEWVYDTDDALREYNQPKKGFKHMRFHFIIENTSDETYYDRNEIIVSADGYQCEKIGMLTDEATATALDDMNIAPGLKNSGYIYRKIPEDAKEVKIQYGEYITINVPLP